MSIAHPSTIPSEFLDPALLDEVELAKLLSVTWSTLLCERQNLEKAVKDIGRRLKSERGKHLRSMQPLIESWEAIENKHWSLSRHAQSNAIAFQSSLEVFETSLVMMENSFVDAAQKQQTLDAFMMILRKQRQEAENICHRFDKLANDVEAFAGKISRSVFLTLWSKVFVPGKAAMVVKSLNHNLQQVKNSFIQYERAWSMVTNVCLRLETKAECASIIVANQENFACIFRAIKCLFNAFLSFLRGYDGKDLELMLTLLETWTPAPTEGGLAQVRIDWLDEQLKTIEPSSSLYSRSFHVLRTLCRRSRRLPSACFLLDDIELESTQPSHQTALSDVYKGRRGDVAIALKSLRLRADERHIVEKAFYDEAVTWRCLRHPNVVPFLGTSKIFPMCLISEWMVYGDIATFLRNRPAENRMPYIKHILSGLCFIHSLKVVHGDIKAANILVNAQMNACLADFGLTTLLQNTGTFSESGTSSARGTLRWMAPELLMTDNTNLDAGRVSFASDMYAVGMVFWEIFTGRIPFDHVSSEFGVVLEASKGHRPQKPEGVAMIGFNDTIWAIMQKCWLVTPSRRPSCFKVSKML